MPRLVTLALSLVAAGLAVPEIALAQGTGPGAANVWTFSTDSSNNLVVQDLASLSVAGAVTGQSVCIQWIPVCPSDVPKPRRRYLLRNVREKNGEWRIEFGNATFSDTGMALPLEVGVGDTAMVQVVSGDGPWTIDLRRVPAVDTKAGDGKKWKLSLNLASSGTSEGCWIEVQCPEAGQ